MPFDVYAGPLCRYFSRDFETPTQRLARGGDPTEEGDSEDALPTALDLGPVIRGWQRLIAPTLKSAGVPVPEWNESLDGPAGIEPLTHLGYWSVRLVAAYVEFPDLSEPTELPSETALPSDAALSRLKGHEARSKYGHLHACAWWLPIRMAEPTDLELPSGVHQPVGSVGMLRAEMSSLARAMGVDLSADQEQSPGGTMLRRIAAETLRRWYAVVDRAHTEQVPVILDY